MLFEERRDIEKEDGEDGEDGEEGDDDQQVIDEYEEEEDEEGKEEAEPVGAVVSEGAETVCLRGAEDEGRREEG